MIFTNKQSVNQIESLGVEYAKKNDVHERKKKDFLASLDLHTEQLDSLSEDISSLQSRIKDFKEDQEWGNNEERERAEQELELLKPQLAKKIALYQDLQFDAGYCDKTFTFYVKRPLTMQDIEDVKRYYETICEQKYVAGFGVTIVLDNTVGQDPNIIKMFGELDCFVNFNVIGGLDRNTKQKYKDERYLGRITYTPINLYNNIREFERIESLIDDSWSDRQKALFVYMSLMRTIEYDYTDTCSSSLDDIRRRDTVCAGFSLIYKEMMDRLGIECEYQNSKKFHAWNVLTLDGEHYALDLTWDITKAGADRYNPTIQHFGLEDTETFYGTSGHKLDNESEEIRYNLSQFSLEDLKKDYSVISSRIKQIPVPRVSKASDLNGYPSYREDVWQYGKNEIGDSGISYCVLDNKLDSEFRTVAVEFLEPTTNTKKKRVFFVDKNLDLDNCLNAYTIGNSIKNNDYYIGEHTEPIRAKLITREDGSVCYITDNPAINPVHLNNYCIFDWVKNNEGLPTIASYRVMTENGNLTDINTPEVDSDIANILLSQNHLSERMEYLGYVGRLKGKEIVTNRGMDNDLNPEGFRAKQEALRLLEKKNEVLQTIDDKQEIITVEEFGYLKDSDETVPDIFDDWK